MLRRFPAGQAIAGDNGSSRRFGRLSICRQSRKVLFEENKVELTSNEFELLWILADAAGTILDRDFLFKALRGIEYDGLDRTIDVTVSRLRKKLGESEIPAKIKELQVHFGYPLAVQKSSSLALNQEETAIFSQDKVIVRNEDSPESLYLQRLPGSDNAMIMGPFAECNVGIMDHVVGFITVGAFMTIFSLAWPFISGASSA